MRLEIRQDPPQRSLNDLVHGPMLRALGFLLIYTGSATYFPPVLMAWGNIRDLFAETGEPAGILLDRMPANVRAILWLGWPLQIVSFVMIFAGNRSLRTSRRLVLFLRRFGHTDTTTTLSQAASALRRRWRFVALDDAQISPIGLSNRDLKRLNRLDELWLFFGTMRDWLRRALWYLISTLLLVGAFWLFWGPIWKKIGRHSEGAHSNQNLLLGLANLVGLCATMGALFSSLFLAWLLLHGYRGFAAIKSYDSNRSAIQKADDIFDVIWDIQSEGHSVTGSPLTVVMVDPAIWRAAVVEIAAVAHLPLIDVTKPTEAVLWELEQMLARFGPKCVVVGEFSSLQALENSWWDDARRLRQVLGGLPVYSYRTDAAGVAQFTQLLRIVFEHHLHLRAPSKAPPGEA